MRTIVEKGYPLTLAMGSLGADRAQRPMHDEDKASVREHWLHVHERSDQPFDFGFFERSGFVYDTEPPSRAVALVRGRYPALVVAFFGRLQERFYALGQDVTDPAILAEAAGEFGIGDEAFAGAFDSPALRASVAAEWQQTARLGVTGYPTLLALGAGKPHVIAIGWRPADEVLADLERLSDRP